MSVVDFATRILHEDVDGALEARENQLPRVKDVYHFQHARHSYTPTEAVSE